MRIEGSFGSYRTATGIVGAAACGAVTGASGSGVGALALTSGASACGSYSQGIYDLGLVQLQDRREARDTQQECAEEKMR